MTVVPGKITVGSPDILFLLHYFWGYYRVYSSKEIIVVLYVYYTMYSFDYIPTTPETPLSPKSFFLLFNVSRISYTGMYW
jgi:hypothetical protein